jgi:hypothetical protein
LEHGVTHRLVARDGFTVELALRADRVAKYAPGVAVIDFKTVSPHPFQLRADTWQVRTYALSAGEIFGLKPDRVRAFVIDLRAARDITIQVDSASLGAAEAELFASARGVTAADFDVAGHGDRPCWCCGFRLECPASLSPNPPREPGS